MKTINLYIDESGNLGSGNGRYFLICALQVEESLKKTISRRAGRIICRYKEKNNISKYSEIKGNKLKNEGRIEILKKILFKGVKVRYIIFDIKKATMLLEKADDKNACYNYLLQLMIRDIVNTNKNIRNINICLDNRTVKIGNRLSLKPYLYNRLVLEQLESNENVKKINFNITYCESESNYLIQWADIVANSIYKKYNSNETTYYDIIKPYIVYESKFPSKTFGK